MEEESQEPPSFIYGLPFSSVSSKDHKAGEKIMANYLYGLMRFGGLFLPFRIIFIGKGGKEREIIAVTKRLSYQGRPGGPEQSG